MSNHPVLTVSQFTNAIKLCLEGSFPEVRLQGEVSNCKLHTSGHLYFTLKDAGAQISAVMYRADAITLKVIPKEGDQVIVAGDINVYPPSGKYQLIVRELKQLGLGELLLKLEELKIKLHKMGWFKADRKRPLPKLPKKIGVVTSPTGAAIQDILHILTRRFSGFELILNPVKVQGPGSAAEIAQAIRQFNEHKLVDVLIVGRGGGSIEDLWAFNEEIVAEAIYYSTIPVISAVGHETDHCIADYVADVRAPTPSAAAEIVIAEKSQLQQHLKHVQKRMHQTMSQSILGPLMQRMDFIRQEADQGILQKIKRYQLLLHGREKVVQSLKPTTQIRHFHHKLDSFTKSLNQVWQNKLSLKKQRLTALTNTLHAVDPKNVLTKGYCILFSEKDHSVITSIQEVEKNQSIKAVLPDGELIAVINEVNVR